VKNQETTILNSENKTSQEQCMEPSFLSQEKFESIKSKFKATNVDDIVKKFSEIMKTDGEMLSPQQSIDLLNSLNFAFKDQVLADFLVALRPFLWLNSSDLKKLITNVTNKNQRITYVENLYQILIDRDSKQNEEINGLLSCDQKKDFDKIKIQFPKPKDCFFGEIGGNNVFIIDLSQSMLYKFKKSTGESVSRLDFLKSLFEKALTNLGANQNVQIVLFNTKARYISGDDKFMFQITTQSKNDLLTKVKQMKNGEGNDGFTNISEALGLAFNIKKNIDKIILFTDGAPTKGITTESGLSAEIDRLEGIRKQLGFKPVSVDVNLLMLGGIEDDKQRTDAKTFTKLIASKTGGIVKNFDGK